MDSKDIAAIVIAALGMIGGIVGAWFAYHARSTAIEVHKIVNSQRDAMMSEIRQLKADLHKALHPRDP